MNHTIVIDFETYYDRAYSLSKMPIQAYLDSPLFEIIGVAVQVDGGPINWFSGSLEATRDWLLSRHVDFSDSVVIAHNAMFDAAILEWRLGIQAGRYFCTASAAQGLLGTMLKSVGLANLANKLGIGQKGTEVVNALGKHRNDFSAAEMHAYAQYCRNDVHLCGVIAHMLRPQLPALEEEHIHQTVLKFVRPQLKVDIPMLKQRVVEVEREKNKLLEELNISRADLMSNDKFARLLVDNGLPEEELPRKPSPSDPSKLIYAFSKQDEAFRALLDHEDPRIAGLTAARLAHKSTIEQTRAGRFIEATERASGALAVPLRYAGAHTLRYSGSGGINLQNLAKKSVLRKAIKPLTPGHVVLAGDLSQIEARLVATLAGETALVEAFEAGRDVYKEFATVLYAKPIEDITAPERFVAKCAILMLGYGAGATKFYTTMQSWGVSISEAEAERTVSTYRSTYWRIKKLWKDLDNYILCMRRGNVVKFGPILFGDKYWVSPGRMRIYYPELQQTHDGWTYLYRKKIWKKLYGGALLENICQHLGRMILAEAEARMVKHGFRAALSVHDELVYTVDEAKAEKFAQLLEIELTRPVQWLPDLPVACEIKWGGSYADCK